MALKVDETQVKLADAELPGLAEMLAALEEAPEVHTPSRFWEQFAAMNIEQVSGSGFDLFKRTVNCNYFQFMPVSSGGGDARSDRGQAAMRSWRRRPSLAPLGARLESDAHMPLAEGSDRARETRSYARYVGRLWDYARRHDRAGALTRLEEPELGAALTVRHRGRRVSEDLCNSAMELSSLLEGAGAASPGKLVVELGPGYGRIAWTMLSLYPGLRYVLVDIPPALAVAQRYLTTLLPERRTFRFRRFDDQASVADELAAAEIVFLMPHQVELLEPLGADAFVNVSSLHEMRTDQIARWFELIDVHTEGAFYTKQWERSENPHDGIVVGREDYPVPPSWTTALDRSSPVNPGFFEAVYLTRAGAARGAT
jgi:putative sugar O-methyltransferase